ncbi:polysaccharide deacetylase family protein [Gemmatimonas sp.]|uniref:polysaccharide deacetylase family protein n=1 Tax=Gemmatimonas sp. TaxID=1962908 RepID=UPI003F7284F8
MPPFGPSLKSARSVSVLRQSVRRIFMESLSSAWFVELLRATRRNRCAIVVMHRFATDHGVHIGHDPVAFRQLLSTLRRHRVSLVDVETAVRQYDENDSSCRADGLSVAFTVDDGYDDLLDVGEPIFAEFDCPVSVFVVPDVIEGKSWFWWDQVDWILRHTDRRAGTIDLTHRELRFAWSDEVSRLAARADIEQALKQLSHNHMLAALDQLAQRAGVNLPDRAPAEYRVLDWNTLRSAEARGVRFGPHSWSHPILSRCTDEQSRTEIVSSVEAVRSQFQNPVPMFCYPNGCDTDFGAREQASLTSAGLHYALSTKPGVLQPTMADPYGTDWRMRIPRISYGESAGHIFRSFL